MFFFCSVRKLSSYLVCAKLYRLEKKIGSIKCGKCRCLVCNNIEENDTFISTFTGESLQINHPMCCNDKCLVYLLTCKICKNQYAGKKSDGFRLHWSSYKERNRKFWEVKKLNKSLSMNPFWKLGIMVLKKMIASVIDKTYLYDPHKGEHYWIRILKTIPPFGLKKHNAK